LLSRNLIRKLADNKTRQGYARKRTLKVVGYLFLGVVRLSLTPLLG
jgi:hypothetical protein